MNNNIKFSVAIPTYKREIDLEKCINTILIQTVFPVEVILIDDDELSQDFVKDQKDKFLNKNIELVYYKKNHEKEKRGSSSSRNIGIEMAKEDIVFILDDDLILEKEYFEETMKVWQENGNKNLAGVGGVITNNRVKGKLEKIYNKIFGLSSDFSWDVNDIGFQSWNDGIVKREKGYYIHGGVCSYDKNITKKLKFNIFQGGRTGLIDPDFCIRAKQAGYFFIIEPMAKVFHVGSKTGREKVFLSGVKEGMNRKIIFRDSCQKSFKNYLWFWWANLGWLKRQMLVLKFKKTFGMIKGYLSKI